jgi:hypothetical protein
MNEFYCDGENSYINFVSSECLFTGLGLTLVSGSYSGVFAMKSLMAVSLLFSVVVLGADALTGPTAFAAQGGLMFHGSVVNAACDPQVLSAPSAALRSTTLQAGPEVTVGLGRRSDACGQGVVPVQARYTELVSDLHSPRAGIVTLTYQ